MTPLANRELLPRVWIERDALTSTDLEILLADRLQEALDERGAYDEHVDAIDEHEATGEQVSAALKLVDDFPAARALLDTLAEFDFADAASLRAQLERLKQFDEVMNDLREPLQSLTNLATTE